MTLGGIQHKNKEEIKEGKKVFTINNTIYKYQIQNCNEAHNKTITTTSNILLRGDKLFHYFHVVCCCLNFDFCHAMLNHFLHSQKYFLNTGAQEVSKSIPELEKKKEKLYKRREKRNLKMIKVKINPKR